MNAKSGLHTKRDDVHSRVRRAVVADVPRFRASNLGRRQPRVRSLAVRLPKACSVSGCPTPDLRLLEPVRTRNPGIGLQP